VSPRKADPSTRLALVDVAARLLAEEGPTALSTRRLSAAVGTSTMAVYTYFGGMEELVREMVHEGFARLHRVMTQVRSTGDPVADVATLGRAYRHNAVANRHLYAVMLGGSSLGGFSLTEADRQHGRYTLALLVDAVRRCQAAGRFRDGDAELAAHQLWSALHGLITLELGGYLIEPYDADLCFESQLRDLMIGAGDSLDAATRSVANSGRRAQREIEAASDTLAGAAPAAGRVRASPTSPAVDGRPGGAPAGGPAAREEPTTGPRRRRRPPRTRREPV
jgi:AcrR family transcriptional regulator